MRRDSPAVRLFVAVHPPQACREAYVAALSGLDLPAGSYRATPMEQVHLTVQFVGQVPEREVESVIESVERSASGVPPFRLTPSRLVTFPESGPPRLVALELDAPAPLLELKRRLSQRLAREPRRDSADDFRPHLTLCRFNGSGRPPRVDQPAQLPGFDADHLILFRSVLRPTGAVHTEVMRAALCGPGPSPS